MLEGSYEETQLLICSQSVNCPPSPAEIPSFFLIWNQLNELNQFGPSMGDRRYIQITLTFTLWEARSTLISPMEVDQLVP